MRIAMLGTRGVPARYGGFETCVEEVGARLAARGHEVVVYCRSAPRQLDRPRTHAGMTLVHLPAVRHQALETISHTGVSVGHLLGHPVDVALLFNSANAPFVPLLRARRIPVATHVDGLEWKRAKWTGLGEKYYRVAEQMSVRWSDALIADAAGIADYYQEEFGAPTVQIAYGARRPAPTSVDRIAELGLERGRYHLVVARFEPENHVDLVVEGYVRSGARLPLVVVGSTPYSQDHDAHIRAVADERVRFLGGVWDGDLLDGLYAGSLTYFHGHSVGGTNPSLLRAMGAGTAVMAFDVNFNREVLRDAGQFFRDADDVAALFDRAESDPAALRAMGARASEEVRRYDWDDVTDRYEDLVRRLPSLRARGGRPSGRRAAGERHRR